MIDRSQRKRMCFDEQRSAAGNSAALADLNLCVRVMKDSSFIFSPCI